jgi:hypothetical protein
VLDNCRSWCRRFGCPGSGRGRAWSTSKQTWRSVNCRVLVTEPALREARCAVNAIVLRAGEGEVALSSRSTTSRSWSRRRGSSTDCWFSRCRHVISLSGTTRRWAGRPPVAPNRPTSGAAMAAAKDPVSNDERCGLGACRLLQPSVSISSSPPGSYTRPAIVRYSAAAPVPAETSTLDVRGIRVGGGQPAAGFIGARRGRSCVGRARTGRVAPWRRSGRLGRTPTSARCSGSFGRPAA